MTQTQFDSLNIGDTVRLSFSANPEQVVIEIDRNSGAISTKTADGTSPTYINDFEDIDFIRPKKSIYDADKAAILEMFDKFHKNGCKDCPFHVECDNVYNEIRMSSTNAFSLCGALHRHENI